MIMANSYNDDENLNKILKHFIHDLRSPLAGLKMVLHALYSRLSEEEKNAIEKAYGRINDMVDNTTLALKQKSVITSSFNISTLIQEVIQEKKVEYMGYDVKFVYNAPENYQDINIIGVQDDFCRMLSNLINNAVEACSVKSGIIRIGLHKSNNNITLAINDNGLGIPGDILQMLRDCKTVTHGKTSGHGIGMQQIREAITKLNGSLDIKSMLGQGSTFAINFELI